MAKNKTSWRKGVSGNPSGRPKGSRDALNEQAIKDIYADWKKGGKAALLKTRQERPAEYVRAVVSLIPKDSNLNVKNDLSDGFIETMRAMNETPKLQAEIARLEAELEELQGIPVSKKSAGQGKVVH